MKQIVRYKICKKIRPKKVYWREYCYGGCKHQHALGLDKKRRRLANLPDECIFCGNKKQIQIHHINKNKKDNNKNNLLKVCVRCHILLHKKIYKNYEPRKSRKK